MTLWMMVTVRGRSKLTAQTLDALIGSAPPGMKLLVIDNGSRDQTLDDLYKRFRLGQIHRLVCNKVDSIPQWEKSYAIRQAVGLLRCENADYFGWIDNDVVVNPGWFAAAQMTLQQLPEVEVCSLHNDPIQEKRHKTECIKSVGPYSVRIKKTVNGAIWVMRWGFFSKHGLPPIGLGINRKGTEDWYYSDRLQTNGEAHFGVLDGFSTHLGYKESLKREAIAKIEKYPVGIDK